ncbi:TPA: hypothetical protein DD449_02020 [Candidatus Berkelbacteria bacterium]|nr:hypothetical protein [Candidatus Berkelbacteria bacterium]
MIFFRANFCLTTLYFFGLCFFTRFFFCLGFSFFFSTFFFFCSRSSTSFFLKLCLANFFGNFFFVRFWRYFCLTMMVGIDIAEILAFVNRFF